MNDHEIVNMLWQRDENAISEMQDSYGSFCYDISYRIVKSREDAEECLNDTWFQTWKSIPIERPDSLKAYVAKIIRNLSLNRIIFNNRWKRGRGAVPAVYEELEEMIGEDDPIAKMINEQAFAELVNGFLRTLERRERNIFVLRFWFFCAPKEIAERYGMKEKVVYNLLYRLRMRFQEYWKQKTEN